MGSDECDRIERSADAALEVLIQAYHALAVIYELSNPGAYTALHSKMMPYLLDSFGGREAQAADDAGMDDLYLTALDRVRDVLDAVRSDVAAVRIPGDA